MTAPARPVAPAFDEGGIPRAIRDEPRWVGWRYVLRGGKWTKPPIDPATGTPADSTDAATWGTFAEARTAARHLNLDGIGFVLGDGWAGADFDGCYDPDSGAVLPDVAAHITLLDSYAEVSPSGRGVKVLVRGTLPPGRRRRGKIELYDDGRFFTVTGAHLEGTPREVNERTEQLASLHRSIFRDAAPTPLRPAGGSPRLTDEQIIARCREDAGGPGFSALWAGSTAAYDGDDSRADLALLGHLAFYTQDEGQLDRLFRRSGLMRDKWGRADYRARTLAMATNRGEVWAGDGSGITLTGLRGAVPPPAPMTVESISLAELQHKRFAPLRWIVADLLPEGAALLAGKAKAKKSWLALGVGLAVAMGGRAMGGLAVERGRVLYMDLEGNQRRIQSRVRAMLGTEAMDWPADFDVVTEWPCGETGIAKLRLWLEERPDTRLVVVDVFADLRGPSDPKANPYEADRAITKALNQLAEERHCAILAIHHTRKMKGDDVFDEISGTTGLQSGVATMWALSRMPDGVHTQLSMRGRDLLRDEPLALAWDAYAHMHTIAGTAEEIGLTSERRAVLDLLEDDQPHKPRDLADVLGRSTGSVQQQLMALVRDGLVDKSGYGTYVIVRGKGTKSSTTPNSPTTPKSSKSVLDGRSNS